MSDIHDPMNACCYGEHCQHLGARLKELEAERDALQARIAQLEQSALTGYEDGWHALRNERDALRARIEDAPCATVFLGACNDLSITTAELNDDIVGKCVRLVIEND